MTTLTPQKNNCRIYHCIKKLILFMLFTAEHFAHCEVRPNSLLSDSVHQIHGSIKMSQKVRYIHGFGLPFKRM